MNRPPIFRSGRASFVSEKLARLVSQPDEQFKEDASLEKKANRHLRGLGVGRDA